LGLSGLRIGWCAIPAAGLLERDEPHDASNLEMSFLKLEGLHVFVTGAAGGIGSAIVEEFLGRRAIVMVHAPHPASLTSKQHKAAKSQLTIFVRTRCPRMAIPASIAYKATLATRTRLQSLSLKQ
jgi:hypothetical protein